MIAVICQSGSKCTALVTVCDAASQDQERLPNCWKSDLHNLHKSTVLAVQIQNRSKV